MVGSVEVKISKSCIEVEARRIQGRLRPVEEETRAGGDGAGSGQWEHQAGRRGGRN